MKTIIKILIALAIVNAAFQMARVSVTNYQFEDDVHESLLFNPRATDKEIVDAVMLLARNQGIPVERENVTVKQVGPELVVEVSYEAEVELLPGIYSRTFTYKPTTSTRLMPGVQRSPLR